MEFRAVTNYFFVKCPIRELVSILSPRLQADTKNKTAVQIHVRIIWPPEIQHGSRAALLSVCSVGCFRRTVF